MSTTRQNLWRGRTMALVAGAVPLLGCEAVLDVPDDPTLVVQAETGPWRCVGSAQQPQPAEVVTATVKVQACDFISPNCSDSITGLTGNLCAKADVACNGPLQEAIGESDGLFEFDVPTNVDGFDGYLEVFGPMQPCAEGFCPPGCDPGDTAQECQIPVYAPSMQFFNPPVTADYPQAMQMPLFDVVALSSVITAAGAQYDPTKGNLFIVALDCDGRPASGVTYSITEHQTEVTQLYVKDGAVTNTVFETDESGIGGFIGVPEGFAEVEAFNEDAQLVGSVGVVARAGFMTYSPLVPSE